MAGQMIDPEFIDPKYLVRGDIIAWQGEQRTIEKSKGPVHLSWAFELVLDGGEDAEVHRDEPVRWFGRKAPQPEQLRPSFEEAIAHVKEIAETQTGATDRSDLISSFVFHLPEAYRDHLTELRQAEARDISCKKAWGSLQGLLIEPDDAWEGLAKLGLVKIVSAAAIDTDHIPENVNKRQVYFKPIGYEIAAYVL